MIYEQGTKARGIILLGTQKNSELGSVSEFDVRASGPSTKGWEILAQHLLTVLPPYTSPRMVDTSEAHLHCISL